MKKSLVALAALAATGAFAQSSVTLYGVAEATVDVGYKLTGSSRTDTFNPAGVVTTGLVTARTGSKSSFRVQDGNSQGVGTSRLGWRGVEDLGGGLKANFLLEMGLRIDDGCAQSGPANCTNSGNSGGQLFGRNAWVGASGGFGETRLGRQVLGSFGVQANSWAAGSSNGLYDAGSGTAPPMGGVRFANAIKYLTPNLGGFSGSVTLSAPEGNSTTNSGTVNPATTETSNKMGLDLAGEYANGPLYVGAGYNKRNGTTSSNTALGLATNVATSTSGPIKAFTVGAAYDLGVVKPFFNYTKQTTDSSTVASTGGSISSTVGRANEKAFSLGVRAPLGAATLIASYGQNKLTSNGTSVAANVAAGTTSGNGTVKAYQIGAQYALSKRTLLEANYGVKKNTATARATAALGGGTIANTSGKESALNVGVRHAF